MLILANENHHHLLMCAVAFAKYFFGSSRSGRIVLIYPVAKKLSHCVSGDESLCFIYSQLKHVDT